MNLPLLRSLLILLAVPVFASPDPRAVVERAGLDYTTPAGRSEEGMPVGNGRMGSLVWTTPSALRFQINRVDVFAMNASSVSFPRADSDYAAGCGYVDINLASAGADVFAGDRFRQHLSLFDALMTAQGRGVTARVLAWPTRDVMAVEIDDQRAVPEPVNIDLRMLRYARQFIPGKTYELEKNHAVEIDTAPLGVEPELKKKFLGFNRLGSFIDPSGIGGAQIFRNRLRLREGPGAIDAEHIAGLSNGVHASLLDSRPADGEQGEPVLRVFPAWPKDWDADFTLLARGAFTVSVAQVAGGIGPVTIVSHAGQVCRLQNPWGGAVVQQTRDGQAVEKLSGALLLFPTEGGRAVDACARELKFSPQASLSASQRSASMAAWQPMPAAVIAWR